MRCQEAGFMHASCRIEIEARDVPDGAPAFRAVMYVVEDAGATLRPIVFPDGSRAEIPAESEDLALNAALAFLSERFGSMTEYWHACMVPESGNRLGDPIVLGAANAP